MKKQEYMGLYGLDTRIGTLHAIEIVTVTGGSCRYCFSPKSITVHSIHLPVPNYVALCRKQWMC